MDELTCNRICHLLCCPPLPSKIAAKLAFMPPPTSYSMITSQLPSGDVSYSISFLPFLKDAFSHIPYEHVNITMGTTKRRNKIVIAFMNINPESKLTFLLSHGNAVDLGLMMNFMYELGTKLNVNIMCYDYSGYGVSSGKPLEKNLYADAECAMHVLMTKYGVPLDHIVLYGQSIGTVPTVHLATIHRVAAVVLHSPLMSGLRVAFPRLKRNYCCDVFSNLARAPRILSPTLVIHGTLDDVVHVSHGYRMCSALSDHLVLEPLFIDGAGHNDCEIFPQYLMRLTKLVSVELPKIRSKDEVLTSSGITVSSSSRDSSVSSTSSATDLSPPSDSPSTVAITQVGLNRSIHRKLHRFRSTLPNEKSFDVYVELTSLSNPLAVGEPMPVTGALSSTSAEKPADPGPLTQLVSTKVETGDTEHTASRDASVQNGDTDSCALPPPPPPPDFTDTSNDFLWSLRWQGVGGKTRTLPCKFPTSSEDREHFVENGTPAVLFAKTLPRDLFPQPIEPVILVNERVQPNDHDQPTLDTEIFSHSVDSLPSFTCKGQSSGQVSALMVSD